MAPVRAQLPEELREKRLLSPGRCFGVNGQVNPYLRNLQLFPTLIRGQSFHPGQVKKGRLTPVAVKGEAAPAHADHSSDNRRLFWQQLSCL